jgi:hypothetical protein
MVRNVLNAYTQQGMLSLHQQVSGSLTKQVEVMITDFYSSRGCASENRAYCAWLLSFSHCISWTSLTKIPSSSPLSSPLLRARGIYAKNQPSISAGSSRALRVEVAWVGRRSGRWVTRSSDVGSQLLLYNGTVWSRLKLEDNGGISIILLQFFAGYGMIHELSQADAG